MLFRSRVGNLTGASEESCKATFSILVQGTILEKAELDVSVFPGNTIEVISFDID